MAAATWKQTEAGQLSRDNLTRLLSNDLACIRVPGFISDQDVASTLDALTAAKFDYYKDVVPPIGRIGITQFEHGADAEGYFAAADRSNTYRRALFRDTVDPVDQVRSALSDAWGDSVDLAEGSDGHPYFAGLVRYMSEALLHCDWAPLDAPGWTIGQIVEQLTWNVYYRVPEIGGEAVVYNRPWTEIVEAHKIPGSYGYDPHLVEDVERVVLKPSAGELVLFNPRNLHEVWRSSDPSDEIPQPRVSVSSFIGHLPSGQLVLWS